MLSSMLNSWLNPMLGRSKHGLGISRELVAGANQPEPAERHPKGENEVPGEGISLSGDVRYASRGDPG